MDTFTLALCRYDRSLHLVISALADPIGVLSLQDARSVFFIRGNTFVEVSLPGLSTASEAASSLKAAVASCLDAHLAAHAIEPPYHRHPDSRLLQPAPVTVVAGKMFQATDGGHWLVGLGDDGDFEQWPRRRAAGPGGRERRP